MGGGGNEGVFPRVENLGWCGCAWATIGPVLREISSVGRQTKYGNDVWEAVLNTIRFSRSESECDGEAAAELGRTRTQMFTTERDGLYRLENCRWPLRRDRGEAAGLRPISGVQCSGKGSWTSQ